MRSGRTAKAVRGGWWPNMATGSMPPPCSSFQLNGLALFGFCREAIRRRVKPLVQCFCKRREED